MINVWKLEMHLEELRGITEDDDDGGKEQEADEVYNCFYIYTL